MAEDQTKQGLGKVIMVRGEPRVRRRTTEANLSAKRSPRAAMTFLSTLRRWRHGLRWRSLKARAGSTSPNGTAFAVSASGRGRLWSSGPSPVSRLGATFRKSCLSCADSLQIALSLTESLSSKRKVASPSTACRRAFILQRAGFVGWRPKRRLGSSFSIFIIGRHGLDASSARRPSKALEKFGNRNAVHQLVLSPYTLDRSQAERWLGDSGAGTDGVVAKRHDRPYESGERAMIKVKRLRTADCVVGGFRYGTDSREVGSLLLGLYNAAGELDHIGFTSTITDAERSALTRQLEALREPPGFTGKAPGGPSRWSNGRSAEWEAVRPALVRKSSNPLARNSAGTRWLS